MKRRLKIVINIIFIALVLAFCTAYIVHLDWQKLAEVKINIIYMAASVALGTLYLFLATFIWIRMLWRLNPNIRPSWKLYTVYAKSWMGRYIPGKVVWVAGKIHFASNYGIPASQLGITSLLEAGVQMVTQLVISMIVVLLDGHFSMLPATLKIIIVIAVIGLFVSLLPPVFNSIFIFISRLLKRKIDSNIQVSWVALGEMTALYSLGYVVLGVSYFLTLKSIIPDLGLQFLPFSSAGISIAGTLGVLALFAPSGLGVREGFIVIFLSLVMPVELAVASAVMLRISALFVDVIFLFLCTGGSWINTRFRNVECNYSR